MKEYKAIFIDWDDTIGDFQGSAMAAQRDIYDKHRLSEFFPSFDAYYELYHSHNVELWERYGRGEVTKVYLQRDRFLWPICHAIGMDASVLCNSKSPLVALADRMGEDFLAFTNKYFRLLPGAAELVRYLASKYPLTVVSNGFVEVQYYKIAHSGLQDCFQHVVLSEEVGIQKPQAGIFEEALRRGKLSAEDVLMIGDSYGSDIQGAKNAGIDQMWIQAPLNPPVGGKNGTSIVPEQTATYIVHSLAEIYDIV